MMTVNAMANNQMDLAMARIASGQRVNSAADDAAGLAIMQGMEAQIRGLDQGLENTRDMQNLIRTADSGLENIGDGLNRIRELSIQAANGTNTQADRDRIQHEITEIVDHIAATTRNTQFNTMPLLDGSSRNTASNPDGTGLQVNIADMSEVAQAVTQFNVAEELTFENLNDIDTAMAAVNAERASLGAMENRLDFTAEANAVASQNLNEARSQIADADIAREVANLRQEEVLNQVQILMQQNEQERAENEQIPPAAAVM
ncbi:MAG: flagellin [Defluviitaleaceae bacterium]|nr:flagellin [Defluviitaleaceae bacterium]MCL2240741.1 flagellin [Defluviitaleaceae bacterium]